MQLHSMCFGDGDKLEEWFVLCNSRQL